MEETLHDRRLLLASLQMAPDLADHLPLVMRPVLLHRLFRVLVQALVGVEMRAEMCIRDRSKAVVKFARRRFSPQRPVAHARFRE